MTTEIMKLDIEITSEEMQTIIQRKVKEVIAEQVKSYASDSYIKERVKAVWKEAANSMIDEVLKDSGLLRAKISAEIERKLRAQLAVAMKNAS